MRPTRSTSDRTVRVRSLPLVTGDPRLSLVGKREASAFFPLTTRKSKTLQARHTRSREEVSFSPRTPPYRASEKSSAAVPPEPRACRPKARWSVARSGRQMENSARLCCSAASALGPPTRRIQGAAGSYLVDPASSYMLVSKIKPCRSKYRPYTAKLRMAH